jgi:hypothetical protein|tara:strand:+ start:451 stop:693 length:243 start_codon:yes stop_codon:yes gene_type:complete
MQPTELRKKRKMDIVKLVEADPNYEYNELIGKFSLATGLTTKTIQTMLKELVDARVLKIEDGTVKSTRVIGEEEKEDREK